MTPGVLQTAHARVEQHQSPVGEGGEDAAEVRFPWSGIGSDALEGERCGVRLAEVLVRVGQQASLTMGPMIGGRHVRVLRSVLVLVLGLAIAPHPARSTKRQAGTRAAFATKVDTTISEPTMDYVFEVHRGCIVHRSAQILGWFEVDNRAGEPMILVRTYGPGIGLAWTQPPCVS